MATHHFTPTLFHNTLGPHAPVLRIADGDTVVTSTVDAHGRDVRGEKVTEGPNPQTGPFYVEGAHPGDTLEVRLEKLWPSRRTGWSGTVVTPNTVDPGFVPHLPEPQYSEWEIDLEQGTAALAHPQTPLGRLTLPLSPMLGCFGVAPAGGQAISASTAGPHGGNMDYNGFVTGVTAWFPVFEPGGLFSLGDGHAIQGDGELVGMGIETCFDVQFTVRVRKGKETRWPRGENDAFLFTVGNARPLDQAVQHATTEMIRWLTQDFGLDARAACILLGQCARYDLGNVIDPAYTMVCKLPKQLLTRARP
ncbi:MAG: acetamidase/formamidase family protein [Armatimonadota bacterium]|nr:acetamidase/formamidase family protein [Armatimonadota bacterium]